MTRIRSTNKGHIQDRRGSGGGGFGGFGGSGLRFPGGGMGMGGGVLGIIVLLAAFLLPKLLGSGRGGQGVTESG